MSKININQIFKKILYDIARNSVKKVTSLLETTSVKRKDPSYGT